MSSSLPIEKIIDLKTEFLKYILNGYDKKEIFVSSSLNRESSLTLFFLENAGIKVDVLFINTGLIEGEFDKNIEIFQDTFDHNLEVINQKDLLASMLNGREFFDLSESDRSKICKSLKKDTVIRYIEEKNKKVWVSGIRKTETEHRKSLKALSSTNNVIKLSPIFDLSDLEVLYILKQINLRKFYELKDLCKLNSKNECGLHL